jgi:hypothetical protein
MKTLIYAPQTNATPDEVLQVLKVFTVTTLPQGMGTNELLMGVYKTLPPEAQRHFKVIENSQK